MDHVVLSQTCRGPRRADAALVADLAGRLGRMLEETGADPDVRSRVSSRIDGVSASADRSGLPGPSPAGAAEPDEITVYVSCFGPTRELLSFTVRRNEDPFLFAQGTPAICARGMRIMEDAMAEAAAPEAESATARTARRIPAAFLVLAWIVAIEIVSVATSDLLVLSAAGGALALAAKVARDRVRLPARGTPVRI